MEVWIICQDSSGNLCTWANRHVQPKKKKEKKKTGPKELIHDDALTGQGVKAGKKGRGPGDFSGILYRQPTDLVNFPSSLDRQGVATHREGNGTKRATSVESTP